MVLLGLSGLVCVGLVFYAFTQQPPAAPAQTVAPSLVDSGERAQTNAVFEVPLGEVIAPDSAPQSVAVEPEPELEPEVLNYSRNPKLVIDDVGGALIDDTSIEASASNGLIDKAASYTGRRLTNDTYGLRVSTDAINKSGRFNAGVVLDNTSEEGGIKAYELGLRDRGRSTEGAISYDEQEQSINLKLKKKF